MLEHEAGGGWSLIDDHLDLLLKKFPASKDVLKRLRGDTILHAAKLHDHRERCELAIMVFSLREDLGRLQRPPSVAWTIKLESLEDATSLRSPDFLAASHARTFRLKLSKLEGNGFFFPNVCALA